MEHERKRSLKQRVIEELEAFWLLAIAFAFGGLKVALAFRI